jgi:hypothetical protein
VGGVADRVGGSAVAALTRPEVGAERDGGEAEDVREGERRRRETEEDDDRRRSLVDGANDCGGEWARGRERGDTLTDEASRGEEGCDAAE